MNEPKYSRGDKVYIVRYDVDGVSITEATYIYYNGFAQLHSCTVGLVDDSHIFPTEEAARQHIVDNIKVITL